MSELQPVQELNPSPFKNMVVGIGLIPTAYRESLTYFGALTEIVKYINEHLIPAVNSDGDAITELQEKYILLKDYVDHYFDNLDVQEEINNKLDDMAEHGELADIIAQYLQLAGVLAFDTIADMQAATNIVNGSTAKTLGAANYLDGKGRYYKIRDITNDDTIDGVNIISITADPTNTLIAELIPDETITKVAEIEEELASKKKMLVVGDSWSMNNYPYTTSQDSMWYRVMAKELNLTVQSYAQSGAGYIVSGNLFSTQVNSIIANEDPDEISKIIIFGGLNDLSTYQASGELYTACTNILSALKTAFPNTEIIVAGINTPSAAPSDMAIIGTTELRDATYSAGCVFVDTNMFMLGYDILAAQNSPAHPNEAGQIFLGGCMISALEGTYTRNPVKKSIPSGFISKEYDSNFDVTGDMIFYNDHVRFALDINVTTALGSAVTLNYTMSAYDLRLAENSLVMHNTTNPTYAPCILNTGVGGNNKIAITIPASVTGHWKGYIDLYY